MDLGVLHQKLFTWWRANGRVLPWREKLSGTQTKISISSDLRETAFTTYFASSLRRDPYRVVVSELMLQQTQVDRVLPKYEAWMKKWPTIADLTKASLPEVLIFWQGLGYNRRARYLWLLAKEIQQRDGAWPKTEQELMQLPGIGPYTARAILSFAMGEHVGVVDTNVKRILSRVLQTEKDFFAVADQVLPSGQADPWNQALMDFGALICTAKNPKCRECPIQDLCEANKQAQKKGFASYAESLPKKSLRKKTTVRFEDTDRYFRGRIIDELRSGEVPQGTLRTRLSEKYGLLEDARFQKLLLSLENEGLVQVTEQQIHLAQ